MERGAANIEEGQLNFSSQTCGYAFACFLLGRPFNTQTPEGLPLTFPRANRGAYVNDDFKVTSRLTVNLGLRIDYNGWGKDAQGLWRTFDFPGVGSDIGRGQGYQTSTGQVIPTIYPGGLGDAGAVKLMKQQFRFFMPRVGIAFRPTDKWVIRSGAGWFSTEIEHLNTFTIFNLMPPKAGSQAYQTAYVPGQTIPVAGANGSTANITTQRYAPGSPVLTLNDPFLTQTGGASVVRPIDAVYAPPDYKDGDVWKWSFDIQRKMPWNSVLSVGYAGSKSSHIGNSVINWNDPVAPVATFNQSLRPYPVFYWHPARPDLGSPVHRTNPLYRLLRRGFLSRLAGSL